MSAIMKAYRRAPTVVVIVAAIIATFASNVAGKVLGVDLGSENIKVAIVQPGRVPISIVTNEMSRRRSPGAVSFYQGERLLGEEAMALEARFPEKLFLRARELLGQSNDLPGAQAALDRMKLPQKVVAPRTQGNRTTLALSSPDDGQVYTAEELMAMVLHYVHVLCEDYGQSAIKDVVITVPAFFGQAQRQALLNAADIAGLNVLSLVGEHAAAALQWGIDKDFVNNTKDVILYDMGAGSITAALVHYSHFNGKEFGKAKTFGQFEVKDVTWDSTLGASDLDILLVNHFAAEFNEKVLKGKDDVLNYPRSVAKLRKQCKKTKEILSANSVAPFSVESLLEDHDFRAEITREKFEELAGDIFDRAAKPLTRLIQQANVDLEKVEAIELLGGGTRIPGVLAALTAALGGRTPDRHLDSDEAIAFGAGLHAANMSTSFRVRKFGAADGASFGMTVQQHGEAAEATEPATSEKEDDEEGGDAMVATDKKMKLLPRMKRIPVKRVVALPNVKTDTKLTVAYEDPEHLPDGVSNPEIASYLITGMEGVMEKYAAAGKVNVHFSVSSSGVMDLVKAEAVVELPEPPAPKKNDTATGNVTGSAGSNATESNTTDAEPGEAEGQAKPAESNEEEEYAKTDGTADAQKEDKDSAGAETTAEEPKKEKKEKPPKKRTARIPLVVEQLEMSIPALTAQDIEDSKMKMREFEKKDQVKKESAEAKNTLEAYIIDTRDKMNNDQEVAEVTTEEQREGLVSELMDTEDWLYMDGENAPVEEFRSKYSQLRAKSDPMFDRVKEAVDRPAAVDSAKKFIDVTRQVVAAWNATKPWINETDKEELLVEVKIFETWLEEKQDAQSKKASHEEPAFKAKAVSNKLMPIEMKLSKLKKTPKPKPPPVISNTTDVNETEATNTTAEATINADSETGGEVNTSTDAGNIGEEQEVIQPPTGDGEYQDEL